MKVTIELRSVKPSLFSASELSDGDIIYLAGNPDSFDFTYPLEPQNIRFVTNKALFDLDGFQTIERADNEQMYTKLPAGTKITLEVTE